MKLRFPIIFFCLPPRRSRKQTIRRHPFTFEDMMKLKRTHPYFIPIVDSLRGDPEFERLVNGLAPESGQIVNDAVVRRKNHDGIVHRRSRVFHRRLTRVRTGLCRDMENRRVSVVEFFVR